MKPLNFSSFFISFLSLLSLFTFNQALAQHSHHNDPPSVHGMLVFGKGSGKIYLSHLPMFHKPHDYQVLLAADLGTSGKEAYQKSKLKHPEETVYTLVPEHFSLPEMIKNPKPFKAKLFQGHFERGGVAITGNITVKIEQVLYFKKFIPNDKKPALSTNILIGDKEEQFLIHYVSKKPDFDQVLTLQPHEKLVEILQGQNHVLLQADQTNDQPLTVPAEVEAKTVNDPVIQIPLQLEQELYLEFNDLSF